MQFGAPPPNPYLAELGAMSLLLDADAGDFWSGVERSIRTVGGCLAEASPLSAFSVGVARSIVAVGPCAFCSSALPLPCAVLASFCVEADVSFVLDGWFWFAWFATVVVSLLSLACSDGAIAHAGRTNARAIAGNALAKCNLFIPFSFA